MSNVVVAGIMIVVLLGLGPVFTYLPISILAAIVISSTKSLFDLTDVKKIAKAKPSDLVQFLATFVVVVFIDVQMGLLVGVAVSLIEVLIRAFRPRIAEMGLLRGTDTFVSIERFPYVHVMDSILVVRLDGEISFGNVRYVGDAIMKLVDKRVEEIRQKEKIGGTGSADREFAARGGVRRSASLPVFAADAAADTRTVVTLKHIHRNSQRPSDQYPDDEFPCLYLAQSRARKRGGPRGGAPVSAATAAAASSPEIAAAAAAADKASIRHTLRAVVLDSSRVVDIDATGCRELAVLRDKLNRYYKSPTGTGSTSSPSPSPSDPDIKLVFAALSGPVRDTLARYGIDARRPEHSHTPANGASAPSSSSSSRDDQQCAIRDKEARKLATDLLGTRYLSVAAAVAELALELKEEEEGLLL
jgi:MFS superfamily sulfate permease-like transporter